MTAPPQVAARARQPPPQKTASSSASEKPKSDNKPRQTHSNQNQNVKLKVVVRGLPPNLPEGKFKEVTAEWINENTVDWYYYVTGKLHERANKPNVRSRAYVRFKTLDYLANFHRSFNGHIFTDSKGRSSRAMVEFAPFQKYVKGKIKPDPRQGTIDTSPEYKEFLESLTQPTSSEPVAPAEEEVTTTPLIEYLRTQKAARAAKEKANKEKMRLAKVEAAQAKANAQTAKLRAEKMQKAEGAKGGEQPVRDGKPAGRGGRSGRGVNPKSGNKSKGGQAPKEIQVAEGSSAAASNATPANSAPPAANDAANSSNTQPVRGRGRGRARPRGVYRPGAGRGGRGRGNSTDGRPVAAVPDG